VGVSATPRVAVVMGSDSDWRVMGGAARQLDELGIAHEARVVSAHRTPEDMVAYGKEAAGRGLQVIIAGAGGAAHPPGMLASVTELPVIGVPITATSLAGMDALLSIAQMPAGIPVAAMAVDNATNAALLAARILALADDDLATCLRAHRQAMTEASRAKVVPPPGG
jgi:5-(carboxyamino)imidazole ribonucleotide mutase